MLGFSASSTWTDATVRQRQIGRALRHQFAPVASQSVPAPMIDLLRKADARWFATAGREFQFTGPATSISSIAVSMAIVGMAIMLWAIYDIAWLVLSDPKMVIAGAIISGLAATFAGAAWLIEGK
jgi:hypothetical protein